MSQKQLGIQAGIDEFSASARMNQYEVGTHHPNLQTTLALCDVLEISPAYLYCEDDALAKLIQRYTAFTKKQQKQLMLASEQIDEGS